MPMISNAVLQPYSVVPCLAHDFSPLSTSMDAVQLSCILPLRTSAAAAVLPHGLASLQPGYTVLTCIATISMTLYSTTPNSRLLSLDSRLCIFNLSSPTSSQPMSLKSAVLQFLHHQSPSPELTFELANFHVFIIFCTFKKKRKSLKRKKEKIC